MHDRYQRLWNNNPSHHLTQTRMKISNNCPSSSSSSSSLCSSRTLHIIRSIVDELYETSNQESSCSELTEMENELSKEKRVRFALETETEELQSIISNADKLQSSLNQNSNLAGTVLLNKIDRPILSESTTIICCSIKARPKIDCGVSTSDNEFIDQHFRSECGTQTVSMQEHLTLSDQCDSLTSLLEITEDRSSIETMDQLSSKTMIDRYNISSSTTLAHSFCCYEKNCSTIESSNLAKQLMMPSKGEFYHIYEEIPMKNDDLVCDQIPSDLILKTFLNTNKSIPITDPILKLCTCSKSSLKMRETIKRKKSDHYQQFGSITKLISSQLRKPLEQLCLPKRCLSSMQNDGLFYIHELIFLFLENRIEFNEILNKQYHISKKITDKFEKTMEKWWINHRSDLLSIVFIKSLESI